MSWLTKLKHIHHLSGAALFDVVEMVKSLHMHFVDSIEHAMQTVSANSDCNSLCISQLRDDIEVSMSMDALDGLGSVYQQQLYFKNNYNCVVSPIIYV